MLSDFFKLEEFIWAVGTVMQTSLRRFKMTDIFNLLLCPTSQLISECDRITENTSIVEMIRRVPMLNFTNFSEDCSTLNFGDKGDQEMYFGLFDSNDEDLTFLRKVGRCHYNFKAVTPQKIRIFTTLLKLLQISENIYSFNCLLFQNLYKQFLGINNKFTL
jgi:hypothetical protein